MADHSGTAFEFALIGDTPYGLRPGENSTAFDKLLLDINSSPTIKWVLHAGDIKSGSTPCSDEMFQDRLRRFNQFKQPFILTPGDNEWTDCHRKNAGAYQPRERLNKLRQIFYPVPGKSLGQNKMAVESQAFIEGYKEFPENVMWLEQQVIFVTLHLVGSRNGLAAFDPNSTIARRSTDDDEVKHRTSAALAWLDAAFKTAHKIQSSGIFIMIHANPGMDWLFNDRTGFETFHQTLEIHVKNFTKPVVLAHGDTHKQRVDRPTLGESKSLPNFTRVETFGGSDENWIRVTVDPLSNDVFSFAVGND